MGMFNEFMNNHKKIIMRFFWFLGSITMKLMFVDSYLC